MAKISLSSFKNYIISEAKKLYQLEILKEENNKTQLSEIDRMAMNAAKKDIQNSGGVFVPLGQSEFEKNIDKKSLNRAMSPSKIKEEDGQKKPALSEKTIATVQKWIADKGARGASVKIIDFFIGKMLGLSSSDLPDSATFANGLDEMESMLEDGDYTGAFSVAKDTAQEMISEEGGGDMF